MLSLRFWYDSYWQWSSGIIFSGNSTRTPMPVRFPWAPAPSGVLGLRGLRCLDAPRGAPGSNFDKCRHAFKNPPRNRRDFGNSTLKASPKRVLLNPQALRGLASKTNVSLARRISRLPGTFGACKARCFLPIWGLLSARSWRAACGFFHILR